MKTPKLIISLTHVDPSASPKSSCPTSYEFVDEKKNLKKRCLLNNLTIAEVGRTEAPELLNIDLDENNRWAYVIDMSHNGVNAEAMKKFWREHPLAANIIHDEDEPLLADSFTYEFTDITIKNDKRVDDEIVDCYTKFRSLTEDQREKVAIYFGVVTHDMDSEELEREMVSLDSGLLTTNAENRADFLGDINKMFDPIALNLQLAEINDVIKRNGDSRMIGGYPIGNNVEECLFTLRKERQLYESLVREIAQYGLIPFSDEEGSGKKAAAKNTQEEVKKAPPAGKITV